VLRKRKPSVKAFNNNVHVYTFFDFCQFYELRLSMTIEKYHPKSLKTAITSLLYFYTVFQKT